MMSGLVEAAPDPFKWVGGRLCLDFVNTVGGRVHGPGNGSSEYRVRVDKLRDARDLAAWARQSGLTTARPGEPERARAALERARRLREAIYRLLRSAIRRQTPAAGDLATLSTELRAARRDERLVARRGGGYELVTGPATFPRDVLGPIAASAVELLTGEDLGRVRQCPGEGCGWLFVDDSRNGRRRWCDMKDCGNLAKVRRFRKRRHSGGRQRGAIKS